jgi:hypothetical protein
VNSQLLAFSRCMRSNGVPSFPGPLPGQVTAKFPSAQGLGVSASLYQTAQNPCQHLLPNGGSAPNQAEVQQELSGMRSFSQCMAPTECRTGLTPPSVPRGTLCSISVEPAYHTARRVPRSSWPRCTNAATCCPARSQGSLLEGRRRRLRC